jgi:hypothetical protein
MPRPDAHRRLSLGSGDLLNLDDARGTTIRVRRGQVWVTQDGDLADHVLDAGAAWAVERNGRTIVQAQRGTIVELTGPGAARAVRPLAAAPAAGEWTAWVHKVANDWLGRRWAPYL